jgi:hypothetical protein
VAVVVGYFLGGEMLGLRTILGTLLVLTSVVVITSAKTKPVTVRLPMPDPATATRSETVNNMQPDGPAKDVVSS